MRSARPWLRSGCGLAAEEVHNQVVLAEAGERLAFRRKAVLSLEAVLRGEDTADLDARVGIPRVGRTTASPRDCWLSPAGDSFPKRAIGPELDGAAVAPLVRHDVVAGEHVPDDGETQHSQDLVAGRPVTSPLDQLMPPTTPLLHGVPRKCSTRKPSTTARAIRSTVTAVTVLLDQAEH